MNVRWFKNNFITDSVLEYDAFDKDIAILNVFFETPTVLEYTTKHSITWFDFIAAAGGIGGLFIGFSIVTILEIIYLFFQAFWLYINQGSQTRGPWAVGHMGPMHLSKT